MLPPEISFSQLLTAVFIILICLTKRATTEYPVSPQKREDMTPIKTHSHHHKKDEKNEVESLQKEVQRLSHELNNMKYNLERFQNETDRKLQLLQHRTSSKHHAKKCRIDFTNWHDTVGKSLEYLDGFDIHCRHGEYLKQWRMTWGEKLKKKAIRFVCCHV